MKEENQNMTFDEYQNKAMTTAINTNRTFEALMYRTLGLTGEAGEVAEKVKKIIRDKDCKLDSQDKDELVKELGDVLWYVQALANYLEVPLSRVAEVNLQKVLDRKDRGVTGGSGDNR